jgi:hypothetical protein
MARDAQISLQPDQTLADVNEVVSRALQKGFAD